MPWKVKDVEKFKKGLSDEEKKEWVSIANKALTSLKKKGKPILEAEVTAIRKANSMFGDKVKAMKFSDMSDTTIELTLSEAGTEELQLVLPTGTTYSDWYGELIFTETFMKEMAKNSDRLKNTRAFLNEGHDRGKACAWAEELVASDDGLKVKWDFTSLGKSLVEDKIYRYFSAEIGSVTDVDTGERVFPVFMGCALTNSPVMKNLPEVHLEEVTFTEQTNGGKEVNFTQIMEALSSLTLSDEEKLKLLEAYKVEDSEQIELAEKLIAKEEVITSLNERIVSLEAEVNTFSEDKVEAKLSEAITAGKITPANKETWKARLSKDFEEYSAILNELVAVVILEEMGSEEDNDEVKPKHLSSDYTGQIGLSTNKEGKSSDYTGENK